MSDAPAIDEFGFGLGDIDPAKDYYSITLTADEHNKVIRSVFSHWVGWADDDPRIEIREASLINPTMAARNWSLLRMHYLTVNTEEQFAIFYGWLGGHALVRREIAEQCFLGAIQPNKCIRGTPVGGFVSVKELPQEALRHVPTPKLRMRVLKRDRYRCKLCGRRPEDHLDLELHVHHIRQWANGGLTQEWNLVTLCSTCHRGLDPHEEPQLWAFINQPLVPEPDDSLREYNNGVIRFRALRVRQMREWQDRANKSSTKKAKK